MSNQEVIPAGEGRAVAKRRQAAPTSLLQVIERAARDPSIDIDKMERLLGMQQKIVAQQAEAQYAAALARLQPKLPLLAERGSIKNNSGAVQSRYALWEDIVGAITPILASEGFSLSFRIAHPDGKIEVTGVLQHEGGHKETTSIVLPADTSGSKNAVQAVASSVSYGKRYTGGALLNLRSGELDDDGRGGQAEPTITEEQVATLRAMLEEIGPRAYANFLKAGKIEGLDQILAKNFDASVRVIKSHARHA